MEKKKLAIVGCGKLANIIAGAYNDGLLSNYQFTAAYSRSKESAQNFADKISSSQQNSCKVCSEPEEMLNTQPDIIIEAANPQAFKEIALPALEKGISVVTLSIGAFADEEFLEKTKAICLRTGAKIYIASGAIGGFDVLKTANLMGSSKASIHTTKGPNSLKKTSVYQEDMQEKERKVFDGNAKEAIALFPTKVNVAVAASLASVGPEKMDVSITSVPDYVGDEHRIEIENEQVKAVIDVYSKTSEIAAWSVVHSLRNIVSPIVFH
ncbi:aspartate dehydrogenase [Salegentibacter echinorum]|uniref:L-aspartate dehydrogenase n=1 Tax=Salegentibacter echinorum TaxID=1073325 RepID=A0A1M5E9L3_SALEC|nr:aspartate dehydrogenase domain-containing protein [Salegentibacter echinorum]SHF75875.1 aspartate dehydrogenase [Salegentibacter echinorum]